MVTKSFKMVFNIGSCHMLKDQCQFHVKAYVSSIPIFERNNSSYTCPRLPLLQLASKADMYVNDAFGTAHRAHASTEGVTKHVSKSLSGFLLQKELDYLDGTS